MHFGTYLDHDTMVGVQNGFRCTQVGPDDKLFHHNTLTTNMIQMG